MPTKKGNKEKKVYYKPEEWERVLQNAAKAKMKPGTYLRWISVHGEMKLYDTVAVEKLSIAINRYGNNLNQIAMVVNSSGSVYKADVDKLNSDVESLQRIIEERLEVLKYELI